MVVYSDNPMTPAQQEMAASTPPSAPRWARRPREVLAPTCPLAYPNVPED
jgi:hypothetical protein